MNAMQLMEALGELPEADIARELSYKKRIAVKPENSCAESVAFPQSGTVTSPKHRFPIKILHYSAVTAACLVLIAGTVYLLNDDSLTQQSSNPEAVMLTADAEPAQTTPAVQPKTETSPAETAPPEDTPAVPAQTETAVLTEYAETAPSEAEPTETMLTETAPSSVVYELGDVDMDGKITYVDAALVMVDYWLAKEGRLDESLINEKQRVLGNVNGLDDGQMLDPENPFSEYVDPETGEIQTISHFNPFPLSFQDYRIIYDVAYLRNWYGLNISASQYQEETQKNPHFLYEYQDTHEKIRPYDLEAELLLAEMDVAIYGYVPFSQDEIEANENELPKRGKVKYTVEDFRRICLNISWLSTAEDAC